MTLFTFSLIMTVAGIGISLSFFIFTPERRWRQINKKLLGDLRIISVEKWLDVIDQLEFIDGKITVTFYPLDVVPNIEVSGGTLSAGNSHCFFSMRSFQINDIPNLVEAKRIYDL